MTKKEARDKLYEYTAKIMGNIAHYYKTTNFARGTDVNLLIERAVSKKVAGAMGDLYVEAEVSVFDIGNKTAVVTSYSTDKGIELLVMHEEVSPPTQERDESNMTAEQIAWWRERNETGRGSKVETLRPGQGLGELSDLEYFRKKVQRGLALPKGMLGTSEKEHRVNVKRAEMEEQVERIISNPFSLGVSSRGHGLSSAPTSYAPMTRKTAVGSEKPTIDFKQISQISTPAFNCHTGYQSGIHVGIDLAKFDVKEEHATQMAKEMAAEIDKKIMEDILGACKPQWGVPTFGWTEEKTDWKTPEDISWRTRYDSMPIKSSEFGGIFTADSAAPYWGDPITSMEEIEFTESELDELIDLIHDCKSEVMKFK